MTFEGLDEVQGGWEERAMSNDGVRRTGRGCWARADSRVASVAARVLVTRGDCRRRSRTGGLVIGDL
jgi:hypothetical protein